MLKPSTPLNENTRIKTLQSLNLLDTAPEERMDRITQITSNMFDVPIALVSLVDSDRQWFKSCIGLNASETSRDISFCGHAILQGNVFFVKDTFNDERFYDNPLVTGEPKIRFYAGCPLEHENGSRLGTLCIIDRQPRAFSEEDAQLLKELATLVELELVQQLNRTIDQETGISNKDGFQLLSKVSLNICAKRGLGVSVGFLYIKGLLSLKENTEIYLSTITEITRLFKIHLRGSDVIARYDETGFIALLTNANLKTTQSLLNELELDINNMLEGLPYSLHCEAVTGVVEGSATSDINDLVFNAFMKLHN